MNLFKSDQGDPFRLNKLSYLDCLPSKGKSNVQILYKELHAESMENEFNKKRADNYSKIFCVEVIQYLPMSELFGLLGLPWENS